MDLLITVVAIILFIFWPRLGDMKYFLLIFLGVGFLLLAVLVTPVLLLSPVLYLFIACGMIYFLVKSLLENHDKKKD